MKRVSFGTKTLEPDLELRKCGLCYRSGYSISKKHNDEMKYISVHELEQCIQSIPLGHE